MATWSIVTGTSRNRSLGAIRLPKAGADGEEGCVQRDSPPGSGTERGHAPG